MKSALSISPLLLVSLLISGCQSDNLLKRPKQKKYDAEKRAAFVIPIMGTNSSHIIGYQVASEPPPDTAQKFAANLNLKADVLNEVDAEAALDFSKSIVDLSNRSQTLQVLRQNVYTLSVLAANPKFTGKQIENMYYRTLDNVRLLMITEIMDVASSSTNQIDSNLLNMVLKDIPRTGIQPLETQQTNSIPSIIGTSGTTNTNQLIKPKGNN